MSYDEAREAIQKWVQTELSITTIFHDQFKMRPSHGPYATVRLDSIAKLGSRDEQGPVDGDGNVVMTGQRRVPASVEVLGSGAMSLCSQLQNSLSKRTTLDALASDGGIVINDIGDVLNITELLDTEAEERAQLPFYVGYATETDDNVGVIERVEISRGMTSQENEGEE